jgi:hypothetical protein
VDAGGLLGTPGSPFQSPSNCFPNSTCWDQLPASTLQVGQASIFTLRPNTRQSGGIFGGERLGYDGYFTYRADVLGGPPEYLTVAISQCHWSGITYGNSEVSIQVYDTSTPPSSAYLASTLAPAGDLSAKPQLGHLDYNTP